MHIMSHNSHSVSSLNICAKPHQNSFRPTFGHLKQPRRKPITRFGVVDDAIGECRKRLQAYIHAKR